jgi:hypothetical protein
MTVNYELIPDGGTINQDFHLAVVKCLEDAGSLHHNKASAHIALPTKQFLATPSIPALPRLLCSPDRKENATSNSSSIVREGTTT